MVSTDEITWSPLQTLKGRETGCRYFDGHRKEPEYINLDALFTNNGLELKIGERYFLKRHNKLNLDYECPY